MAGKTSNVCAVEVLSPPVIAVASGRVTQPLHSIENAVSSAKKTPINHHIDHCLLDAGSGTGGRSAVEEFRAISKYL